MDAPPDPEATRQFDAEGARHAYALRALRPGDRRGFETEMSRHLRRVDVIQADSARRAARTTGREGV